MTNIPIFENKVVLLIIGLIIGYLLSLFINKNDVSSINKDTDNTCEENDIITQEPQEPQEPQVPQVSQVQYLEPVTVPQYKEPVP